jgi:hypothetical protein
VVLFGGFAEAVEDDAGLDDGELCCRVDGAEPVHVLRVIEDDGYVGALAGERGSATAWENGCTDGAAGCECGFDVGGVKGHDDADGKLTVIRSVGGVEGARAPVEFDFTTEDGAELCFQFAVGGEALVVQRLVIEDCERRKTHADRLQVTGDRRQRFLFSLWQ